MSGAATFFTDGAAYECHMGRWSRAVGEIFLDWLSPPRGLCWLDVGCGNGAFTEAVIARCTPGEVLGIDPSEAQLAYARSRAGARLAQFQLGDAQSIPFADRRFDFAAMALVISFIPDPAKAVAEMVRVVRPGGWVASYMWDTLGGGLPLEPIRVAMRSLGIGGEQLPGAAVARLENLDALWLQAGLQSVDTRVIRIPITYPDFDDFWSSIGSGVGPLGKTIREMSPGAREQLKARLREQLPKDDRGHISYGAHANAVKGCIPD
jgi:SAM-dependent methyltransferase